MNKFDKVKTTVVLTCQESQKGFQEGLNFQMCTILYVTRVTRVFRTSGSLSRNFMTLYRRNELQYEILSTSEKIKIS